MTSLPKEGRSQEIGRLAARALGNKLPVSWIEKELDGDSDFGIDYIMQLKSSDHHVAASFYLQLKGTTSPSYSADKKYISYDFKVKTLNYYLQQEPLVMVAVVDLAGNENELWKCPIYYFWLEEDWFSENQTKLGSQEYISVKISTAQLLDQSLNVYDFYHTRIDEKFALAILKKEIKFPNKSVLQSIETLTEAIVEKPVILKSIEEKNDAPWIHNPEGTVANELKRCSENLNANKLTIADRILDSLVQNKQSFTANELAEFYYQTANLYMLQGSYNLAEVQFKLAHEADSKDRYHLGYLGSRFKLEDSLPPVQELEEIVNLLGNDSYQKCFLKAKSLALLNKEKEAITLLQDHYPDKIAGQMVIYTMKDMGDELDQIIAKHSEYVLSVAKDTFAFNTMIARRCFYKATQAVLLDEEVVPFQGKPQYDLKLMRDAFIFLQKAWGIARELGYPSDITILLDISPLVYGYFNQLDELEKYIEEMLSERPNHPDLIRPYSRILFNKRKYQRVIDLIERLEVLDADENGLHLLSYYNLGKSKKTLELVQLYEQSLLTSASPNVVMIFCVAAEIANELFDEVLAKKYENLVKDFTDGEAFIAVRNFVSLSNAEPERRNELAQDLYRTYLRLDRPLVIAEQLSRYLDVYELSSAEQVIELNEQILKNRELTNSGYTRLAQAFFTTKKWIKAAELAEKNIAKGIEVARWKLMQAASLQQQGKVGVALNTIKEVMSNADASKDQQEFYIELCLSLGLLKDAIEVVQELITNTAIKNEKVRLVQMLISIYSNSSDSPDELQRAIDRYGELVDQDNCEQEGQYLIYRFTCPVREPSEEQIRDFQVRLALYTEKFPQSPILKQGSVSEEADAESMLQSIRELTGITDEQIKQWENNKQKIRNGSLPVPFSMRGSFLSDTRNIYSTWVLSLNYPEEYIEYKIKHAPQLPKDQFNIILKESKIILLEETTLLVLSELNLLDSFLGIVPKFSLIKSVFEHITRSAHQFVGAPYNLIPKKILQSIQNHLDKLQLIDVKGENSIEIYSKALEEKEILFLTEDLYLNLYLALDSEEFISGNIFNILEMLSDSGCLNEGKFYQHVSKVCGLGFFDLNMQLDLLSMTFKYYLNIVNGVDYTETGFKPIFNKLFAINKDNTFSLELLFRMLNQVASYMDIHAVTLLSLFNGFLIRHPITDIETLIAHWLIVNSIQKVPSQTLLIGRSEEHYRLWEKYQELMIGIKLKNITFNILAQNIILKIFCLNKELHEKAYQAIKSSFIPMTQEAEVFENIYQQFNIANNFIELAR